MGLLSTGGSPGKKEDMAIKQTQRYKGVDMGKVKGYSMPKRFGDSTWLDIFKDKKRDNDLIEMRLLPPVGDMEGLPWVEHYCHYADGRYGSWRPFKTAGGAENEANGFGLTCLQQHTGEECPVCKLQEWAEENEQDELCEQLNPNVRFYCNVVLREDGKAYSWSAPQGVVTRFVQFLQNPKIGDFTHPEHGRDIVVQKQTGARTRYQVEYDPDKTPIVTADGNGAKWQEARDLTKAIKFWSAEEMIDILVENLQSQAPVAGVFGKTAKVGIKKKAGGKK